MRTAELATAAGLAILSLFFMSYAAKLPIGWTPGAGPGGGALPFWLSLAMLCGAVFVFLRELRFARHAPGEPSWVHPDALSHLVATAVGIVIFVAMFDTLGAYVAIPVFIGVYLRIVGRHGWGLVLPMALVTPVVLFFFFEVALQTLLPKGITEPLFLPLYAIFF